MVVVSVVACVFWVFDFGAGASPSVPELLIAVTVLVALFKECFVYAKVVERLGFFDVPKTAMTDVSASHVR